MTMQSRGGFGTPRVTAECIRQTGTAGQIRVSGEENSTFLPCHGARSPRPPLDFLSHWARLALIEGMTRPPLQITKIFVVRSPSQRRPHACRPVTVTR